LWQTLLVACLTFILPFALTDQFYEESNTPNQNENLLPSTHGWSSDKILAEKIKAEVEGWEL
jgi:hypothetical protein